MTVRRWGTCLLTLYAASLFFASWPEEFLPPSLHDAHASARSFQRRLLMEAGMGVFKGSDDDERLHVSCFKILGHTADGQSFLLHETYPKCIPGRFLRADVMNILLFRAFISEPGRPKARFSLLKENLTATSRFFCYGRNPRRGISEISILSMITKRSYTTGEMRTSLEALLRYDCNTDREIPAPRGMVAWTAEEGLHFLADRRSIASEEQRR